MTETLVIGAFWLYCLPIYICLIYCTSVSILELVGKIIGFNWTAYKRGI